MRIVHVVGSGGSSSIQGIERHVLYLAAAQNIHGTSAMVVTDNSGMFSATCHQQGIPVVVAQCLATDHGMSPAQSAVSDMMGIFREFDADLIHCHTLTAAVQAIPAGNQMGVPCVFTLHASWGGAEGTISDENPLTAGRRIGLNFATIAVFKGHYDSLKKGSIPEADLYYVPNGTETVPVANPREARSPAQPNLIMVGSLTERKAVDIAILALAELRRRRGHGWPTLNIYGDGDQGDYLREMTGVLGLGDTVCFHGVHLDILKQCASSDVLLVSSRAETGPLVVLEAMSRGMPAVTTRVGEVSSMIPDRRYGRIVPVGAIVALADAVESLLADITDGRFDPDLLIERHRSLFTIEKMTERIEAVYKKVMLVKSTDR